MGLDLCFKIVGFMQDKFNCLFYALECFDNKKARNKHAPYM